MPFSNYPNGFANGLSVRGMPLLQMQPGQVFFVGNSSTLNPQQRAGSDGNRGTFLDPFATLDYAVNTACTAGRGDIVFVLPGHAETISTATAARFTLQGVAVVGLGSGSLRPTFTLDTGNTVTIPVSADDCSIQNCIFVANFLTIAACFTLAAAKNFAVNNCEFRDTAANKNWANLVKSTGVANTVDGLSFTSNFAPLIGTTFNTTILTANDIDRLQVVGNIIKSIATTDVASLVVVTAGVITGVQVVSNVCIRKNTTSTASLISVGGTTSSGIIQGNFTQTLDTATNVLFATTVGLAAQGNSISGAIGAQGFPIPALDS